MTRLLTGIIALGGLAILATSASSAGPEQAAAIDGTFAGTFLCNTGELGMTLTLKDAGAATPRDLKKTPCRSGAGPCNDREAARLKNARKLTGVVNFFPTVGNPKGAAGAFRVVGALEYVPPAINRISLRPDVWLQRSSALGATGLTGTMIDDRIHGTPTADGCYALRLHRLNPSMP